MSRTKAQRKLRWIKRAGTIAGNAAFDYAEDAIIPRLDRLEKQVAGIGATVVLLMLAVAIGFVLVAVR